MEGCGQPPKVKEKCAGKLKKSGVCLATVNELIRKLMNYYYYTVDAISLMRVLRGLFEDDAGIVSTAHRLEEGLHHLARSVASLFEYLRALIQQDYIEKTRSGEFKDPYDDALKQVQGLKEQLSKILEEYRKKAKEKENEPTEYVT